MKHEALQILFAQRPIVWTEPEADVYKRQDDAWCLRLFFLLTCLVTTDQKGEQEQEREEMPELFTRGCHEVAHK